MAVTTRMPAAFIGHGSPMNTLEDNRYTDAWKAFGAAAPRPRAIVAISAHWYVAMTAVTAMAKPRTIHDFFGFPKPLFDFEYPAPGEPTVAEEILDVVKPTRVGRDVDGWGIDHGTWSVLAHAFPAADIPVVQLSIHVHRDLDFHFELGARLAPLRERGILIVASGNVVHNLRAIDWGTPDAGFDWAERFDEAARDVVTKRPKDIASLLSHPDYAKAVPTPDHFLPLVYFAGLASADTKPAQLLAPGYAYGSLSMTCYTLDAACPTTKGEGPAAELPPDPEDANV
jgi:4,5-DOPA dioxygenase extradiol